MLGHMPDHDRTPCSLLERGCLTLTRCHAGRDGVVVELWQRLVPHVHMPHTWQAPCIGGVSHADTHAARCPLSSACLTGQERSQAAVKRRRLLPPAAPSLQPACLPTSTPTRSLCPRRAPAPPQPVYSRCPRARIPSRAITSAGSQTSPRFGSRPHSG